MSSSIVPFNPNPDKQPVIFHFNGIPFHAFQKEDGEFWFDGNEVCNAVDVVNSSQAISRLDDDERAIIILTENGVPVRHLMVSEAGLYRLAMSSRKPIAKTFQRWIAHDVLPALRQTGRYEMRAMSPAEIILMQAQRLVDIERAQAAQADSIRRIEARQDAVDEKAQYFTVVGYALYIDRHIDKGTASTLGKRATALSKQQQIPMGKAKDTNYGSLNTYHESILKAVFDAWLVQFPLLDES